MPLQRHAKSTPAMLRHSSVFRIPAFILSVFHQPLHGLLPFVVRMSHPREPRQVIADIQVASTASPCN